MARILTYPARKYRELFAVPAHERTRTAVQNHTLSREEQDTILLTGSLLSRSA
jgi:hypothetical protein